MSIDREAFFDGVRQPVFHGMTQSQVDGCNSILDEWEAKRPAGDLRHLAYMLATAWWETDHTMQPIDERGRGQGRAYGAPAGPWHQVYYGRGDVQLTWLANYQKADKRLHALAVLKPGENLAETPALAKRCDVAAAIMIFGMTEGWFTGKKLSDFIAGIRADYVSARRIINGLDKAQTIAAAAVIFAKSLRLTPDKPAVPATKSA